MELWTLKMQGFNPQNEALNLKNAEFNPELRL